MAKKKKDKKKEPSIKTEEDIIKDEEKLIKEVIEKNKEDEKNDLSEDDIKEDEKEDKKELEKQKETKKEKKEEKKEDIKLKIDIPPITEIIIEDKKEKVDYEHYFFSPDTKIYTCKQCNKEYKREGSCVSHIKKIHYKGKDIKIDKEKLSKYVPIMTYKEFKSDGKQIAIIIMNFLTYNIPLWVKLLIDRKAFKLLPEEKKYKLTVFAQNLGTENIKYLEKSFPVWSKDFYRLLCDLKIFNIIFKIKYLALITTFVTCAKNNYKDYSTYAENYLKPYKNVIDITTEDDIKEG